MDGPIPARQTRQTITRATRTFTRGGGSFMVPTSTLATQPNLAQPSDTPPTLHLLGTDQRFAVYAVPAIAANATYELDFTIGMPNLTSWPKNQTTTVVTGAQPPSLSTSKRSLTSFGKDVLLLIARCDSVEKNDTSLVIVSQACAGQGTVDGFVYNGPSLPTGVTYQKFAAVGTIIFLALSAYAGGNVTVHVSASMHVQPG